MATALQHAAEFGKQAALGDILAKHPQLISALAMGGAGGAAGLAVDSFRDKKKQNPMLAALLGGGLGAAAGYGLGGMATANGETPAPASDSPAAATNPAVAQPAPQPRHRTSTAIPPTGVPTDLDRATEFLKKYGPTEPAAYADPWGDAPRTDVTPDPAAPTRGATEAGTPMPFEPAAKRGISAVPAGTGVDSMMGSASQLQKEYLGGTLPTAVMAQLNKLVGQRRPKTSG
jgi:hypothetical protein